jgi:CheY-like chemotaxis protein
VSGPTLRLDVLLVDDDPVVRKNYGAELRAEGCTVTVAADGDEALAAAWERRFDVVLLDLRMPLRSGPEVLRAMRTRTQWSDTAVFLLAQSGDADLVEEAMREGAQGVIEKGRATPRDVVHEIAARFAAKRAMPARATVADDDASLGLRVRALRTPTMGGRARNTPAASTAATVVGATIARRTPAPAVEPSRGPRADDAAAADGASYSTMISRFVGDSARLAAAMGLAADFACGACRAPLALLLAPDASVQAGVRGRFHCPHCDAR